MTDTYKPSWVPEEENDKFACRVMYGVTGGHEGTPGVTAVSYTHLTLPTTPYV